MKTNNQTKTFKIRQEVKDDLHLALLEETDCGIQCVTHKNRPGWCCVTCFFSISKKLSEQDWQTVLLIRGDYKEKDLTNLPKDIPFSVKKIFKILIDKRQIEVNVNE